MTQEDFLNAYKEINPEETEFSRMVSNKYKEESLDAILTLRKEFCFTAEELQAFLFEPLQPHQAIENATTATRMVADLRLLGIFKIEDLDEAEAVLEKQKTYLSLIQNNFSVGHLLKIIEYGLDRNFLVYQRPNMVEINRIFDTLGMKLLVNYLNDFDEDQKREIIIGLLKPSVAPRVYLYAHPQFSSEKMEFIRNYLESSVKPLDKVFFLLQPEFSLAQLQAVSIAIDQGLSIDQLLELSRFKEEEVEDMKNLIKIYKKPQSKAQKKIIAEPITPKTLVFTHEQHLALTAAKADKLSPDVLKYIQNPQFPPELMKIIHYLTKEQVPLNTIKEYLQKHNEPNVWVGLYNLKRQPNLNGSKQPK